MHNARNLKLLAVINLANTAQRKVTFERNGVDGGGTVKKIESQAEVQAKEEAEVQPCAAATAASAPAATAAAAASAPAATAAAAVSAAVSAAAVAAVNSWEKPRGHRDKLKQNNCDNCNKICDLFKAAKLHKSSKRKCLLFCEDCSDNFNKIKILVEISRDIMILEREAALGQLVNPSNKELKKVHNRHKHPSVAEMELLLAALMCMLLKIGDKLKLFTRELPRINGTNEIAPWTWTNINAFLEFAFSAARSPSRRTKFENEYNKVLVGHGFIKKDNSGNINTFLKYFKSEWENVYWREKNSDGRTSICLMQRIDDRIQRWSWAGNSTDRGDFLTLEEAANHPKEGVQYAYECESEKAISKKKEQLVEESPNPKEDEKSAVKGTEKQSLGLNRDLMMCLPSELNENEIRFLKLINE